MKTNSTPQPVLPEVERVRQQGQREVLMQYPTYQVWRKSSEVTLDEADSHLILAERWGNSEEGYSVNILNKRATPQPVLPEDANSFNHNKAIFQARLMVQCGISEKQSELVAEEVSTLMNDVLEVLREDHQKELTRLEAEKVKAVEAERKRIIRLVKTLPLCNICGSGHSIIKALSPEQKQGEVEA